MSTHSLLIINGPNLNLLGTREPQKYGTATLADIEQAGRTLAGELNCETAWFQSNHEGAIIDRIHQAKTDEVDHIIINAGAFTHSSIAIRDALLAVSIPCTEVHLSNVHARESFRHHSYLSDIAAGVIMGFGAQSYQLAIRAAAQLQPTET